MDLFVIGDRDTVLGFRLIGAKGTTVQNQSEARQALERALTREEIKMLCVTCQWADELRADIDQLKESSLHPIVLEIPGSEADLPRESISEMVERMMGIGL